MAKYKDIEHYFHYNGHDSREFGLKIKDELFFTSPERAVDFEDVPGYGTVSRDRGYYYDIFKTFPCRMHPVPGLRIDEQVDNIIKWLRADGGWHKLSFTGYPGYYFTAMCNESFNISDIARRMGDIEINFRLKPVKHLVDGDIPMAMPVDKGTFTIVNSESVAAKPLIEIVGQGDITVTFKNESGEQKLVLKGLDGSITVDSELQQATRGEENLNAKVASYPFPLLDIGCTELHWTGAIEKFSITPRWGALVS